MAFEVGAIVEGKVTGITAFGAFVDLGDGTTGMVHISEVAQTYVTNIKDFLKIDQVVKVKVISIDNGKMALSIKKAMPAPPKRQNNGDRSSYKRHNNNNGGNTRPADIDWARSSAPASFEDMMNQFKQNSDDKMSDLRKKNPGEVRRGGSSRRGGQPPR